MSAESDASRRLADTVLGLARQHDSGRPAHPAIVAAVLAYGSAREREGLEKAAKFFEDTEARAAEAHGVYMVEARRQGDVRHKDAYADLSEPIKEFDRVLVRWVVSAIRALLEPAHDEEKPDGK